VAGEGTLTVVGRLGADPDLKFLDSGVSVTKMSLANTQRMKDKDGNWTDRETIWYRLELWGKAGEAAADALSKGDLVIATGALFQSSWTNKNGEEVRDMVIRAEFVGKVFTSKSVGGSSAVASGGADPSDPWQ
jgi:single-strand DNA-binding protein